MGLNILSILAVMTYVSAKNQARDIKPEIIVFGITSIVLLLIHVALRDKDYDLSGCRETATLVCVTLLILLSLSIFLQIK